MTDAVDVAVIGAGPYGLSLAAHLSAAGVGYRQFGMPMRLWRDAMPKGMYLKSQGFASNLSDPGAARTLEAFCAATGRPYASYGLPVPLDTFVAYGQWFRSELGLAVEEALVTNVAREDGGFRVSVDGSADVTARAVVVAVGVEHFAYVPEFLSGLPEGLCTHSSAHTDLSTFRGQQVIVIGAGQSALESAALLHESGADVTVLAREPRLAWNGNPLPPDRPLPKRIREPESGLGSGWSSWFYSNHPQMFRHLPRNTRVYRARTALGPAGACWLRSRVEGQFTVLTGHAVTSVEPQGSQVRLEVTSGGTTKELTADHIIAGTGYRADLSRVRFLSAELQSALRGVAGTPVVGPGYESSVHGLYFIGPLVAPTMGPVMRFVYGSRHAATTVGRQLAGAGSRVQPPVPAGR